MFRKVGGGDCWHSEVAVIGTVLPPALGCKGVSVCV